MAANPRKNRQFLYITVCIGNLAAFSGGIMVGWSSPINAKLTDESRLDENPLGVVVTSDQESWISSAFGLGAIFGPFIAGTLTNMLGRKKILLICCASPLLVSYLMLAFGKHISLYYIARFVAGFAYFVLLSTLPHFYSEISDDAIRGTLSSSIAAFNMFGALYAYSIGPYISIMWFNVSCAVWPALFLILFFSLVPESPYYFILRNDPANAKKSLKKFRSDSESNVMKEMEDIKRSIEKDKENIGSISDVFKSKSSVKALIITISLLVFQQFSGIIVVLFNAQTIFSATGSDIPPEISTIIIGVVQFAASFITPLVVDKLGRKVLLLLSAVGMCIAEVPLGLYFYLNDGGKDVSSISWLPMVCLILYIISYNTGFGILPWTVMAEVFPANIKAPASTVTACAGAVVGFVVTYFFASLNTVIGMGGTFWLFSAFCALAVPFVIFYMIETKGRSFQEIQDILGQ